MDTHTTPCTDVGGTGTVRDWVARHRNHEEYDLEQARSALAEAWTVLNGSHDVVLLLFFGEPGTDQRYEGAADAHGTRLPEPGRWVELGRRDGIVRWAYEVSAADVLGTKREAQHP